MSFFRCLYISLGVENSRLTCAIFSFLFFKVFEPYFHVFFPHCSKQCISKAPPSHLLGSQENDITIIQCPPEHERLGR